MRLISNRSWLAAALMTVLIATTAVGQGQGRRRGQGGPGGPGGPGGRGGMGMMGGGMGMMSGDAALLGLMRVEEVQKEVDLMPDQIDALPKLQETAASGFDRELFGKMREASESEREELLKEMREKQEEAGKKLTAQLEELLLPNQLERLREIALQQQGFNALFNATVVEKLKITEEQTEKLQAVRQESGEKMREELGELFRSGDRDKIGEKMEEFRKQQMDEGMKVLSSDQRTQFKEMQGEPFDLPQGAMMRGPGGRGGPGGPGGRGGRGGRGGQGGPGGRGGDRDNV